MIEIFKFFILPVVPTIIILGGQYYVVKHNLLVGRMERLSKDLERKLFDISKRLSQDSFVFHRDDSFVFHRDDLKWITDYIKIFNAFRRKHWFLFSLKDKKDLQDLSTSLEDIYNSLSDDDTPLSEKVKDVDALISKVMFYANKVL